MKHWEKRKTIQGRGREKGSHVRRRKEHSHTWEEERHFQQEEKRDELGHKKLRGFCFAAAQKSRRTVQYGLYGQEYTFIAVLKVLYLAAQKSRRPPYSLLKFSSTEIKVFLWHIFQDNLQAKRGRTAIFGWYFISVSRGISPNVFFRKF